MEYILKLFDTDLLRFIVTENTASPVVKITWWNEEKRNLLPLGMEPDEKGLSSWLRNRAIPRNRAYVNAFLAEYYGAAEPPVRWWQSHLSGLSEPPRFVVAC